ncbi:MAG: PAS domain S-box protein [Treponema sp.]|nr:PAS domain S-box protein [Treponema sp.]
MEPTKKNILIVDDEAIIALEEQRRLEKAGYTASYAPSGEKAIELVGENPEGIDLILMDIDLGKGMDGTQAAREILRRFDIPLLFLSSHVESEIVERTESITSYGYVVKSSSFTVLDASMKMAFKLFAAQRRIAATNRETEAVNERLRESLERLQKAHDELALSESKLSKVFRLSPDEITITRLADGTYIDINEGFVRLMGYTRDEVLGRSSLPGDLDIWVHPEDRKRLLAGVEKGEVEKFETEFRRSDGSIITVSISAHLIDIDGERFIISITRDITERLVAEEAYEKAHAILDSMMDSQSDIYIVSIDKDYRCLYRNRAYHDIKLRDFGVDVQVGTRLLDYIERDSFFRDARPYYDGALAGEPMRVVEEYRQQGISFEAMYSPMRSSGGEVIGATSFSVDITDELRANEKLKAYARRQETLMKELEHRVKNSLAIVSSLLGIASQEVSDAKALGFLRDTRSRIQSMSTIYERLYLTGKVESLDFGAYLESLAAAIFAGFSPDSDRIRLEIAVHQADLDTKRAISLGLIANELLTNCFKHAFPGDRPGKVRLNLDAGPDRLTLTVSDDGVGLPAPLSPRTASTMGMLLIRELVDQIDGSMAVDTSAGTSFSVSLTPGKD